jgi:pimeloyl-ACP methyl ester carboxylesterase
MLAAIEGTGESWSSRADYHLQNGFIPQFFRRYSGRGNARYFAGPSVSGSECPQILDEVCRFIEGEIRTGDEEINLVGYSRGGFIAICVARYFSIQKTPVNFLGLFDAVRMTVMPAASMSPGLDVPADPIETPGPYQTNTIPGNVRYCYHAIRDPLVGSRTSWGNTAYDQEPGIWEFEKKKFMTSHSGMGGLPGGGDVPDSAREEIESARVGSWMSQYAMKHGLLTRKLVPVPFHQAIMRQG